MSAKGGTNAIEALELGDRVLRVVLNNLYQRSVSSLLPGAQRTHALWVKRLIPSG